MKVHILKGLIVLGCCATGFLKVTAQLSPQDAVAQMKRGINLGNTLEPPYENAWNNPPAEEIYFDLYKEAGFDVVRIPVKWDTHTGENSPYKVDETWMDRVEEVVDWGLSRDLFVVMNAHHEEWIKEDYENPAKRDRFDSIWSQISTRFSNKPEKLIFEIINEPYGLTRIQNDELHERVLSIIRKTNPVRNVIIQGHNWGGSEELIQMRIPEDNHLIGSFHSYDPWPFGLEGTGSFGSDYQLQVLDQKFAGVKAWSGEHSIPIFLGEFGCNRSAEYNSRMKHYRAYVDLSLSYGFTFCAWDDGGSFRILLRSLRAWDEVKDILIHSGPDAPTITMLSVVQDTLISIQWHTGAYIHDSTSVERRSMTGTFTPIAVLPADSSIYLDHTALQGQYNYYRIISHLPNGEMWQSHPLRVYLAEYQPKIRAYFLGEPIHVPGIVEAEDFDKGGEGLTYHDMDPQNIAGAYRPDEGVDIYERNGTGYHVGNALPGEWCEYSLQVEQEGIYTLDVQAASMEGGGQLAIQIGENPPDTITLPATYSWLETGITSLTLSLSSGEQIMRITVVDLPLFNLDKIVFTLNTMEIPASSERIQDLCVMQDPSGDLLVMHARSSTFRRVALISMSGSIVASFAKPDAVVRIPSTMFFPGIYLVRAECGSLIHHKKIMIH
ncbi:MAG TPA: carbohydrate-binding protein [Bacteroides sp.]|nr:carbohydrate-binding protein [Bacteroides sp.]